MGVIAAAASQAIAATQQMQQGRRIASLKASYEALQQLTQSSTDLSLLNSNPSLALQISDIREVAANTVVVATTTHSTKKQKRRREPVVVEPPPISTSPMEGVIEEPVETEEWVEGE